MLNFKIQQDRQCTCKVTLGRVHETTVAVEKQYVLHISVCVCVCVCVWVWVRSHRHVLVALLIQYAMHCHFAIRSLWLHHIFQHDLIKARFSEENYRMYILIF